MSEHTNTVEPKFSCEAPLKEKRQKKSTQASGIVIRNILYKRKYILKLFRNTFTYAVSDNFV